MGFGYGLALSSSLLQGTADFIGGTLSRRISPIRVVALSQAFALLLLLPVLILAPHARPPVAVVVGAAAAGVLSCASLLTQYAACAAGAFGVVATIGAASAVVPVAVDVVRYGPLPVPHLIGSLAAVTGAALAAAPNRHGRAVTTARSIILAGTSAICFGLTLVFVGELAGADDGGASGQSVRSLSCGCPLWLCWSSCGSFSMRVSRADGSCGVACDDTR